MKLSIAATKFLEFLANVNVVAIKTEEEWSRFRKILKAHNMEPLLSSCPGSLEEEVRKLKLNGWVLRELESGDWDGKTVYAELQRGKGSIGVYPLTRDATTGWYGDEPFSVDDIE